MPAPAPPPAPPAQDVFAPINLFPFPVFSTVIAGYEAHKEPLRREILALREKHPGIVRSNRHAWHSGDEFFHQRSEHVAWMLQKATKYAHHALARYYDNWSTTALSLTSCWANVLGNGGWNAPHHHFPCHWSGVYYVQVGRLGTGPEDPAGYIEFLNPTPWQTAFNRSGNFLYGPKEGLILIFPASLYHFVHPNYSDDLRISIAYNFTVVPKGGGDPAVTLVNTPGMPGTPGGPPIRL